MNDTYIYYGAQGYHKMKLQSAQDNNASELDEVVVVKRAVSKSSRVYKNSSWDLVDAEDDKNFSYDKLDKKSLPKELQNKSRSALKKYVGEKKQQRKNIQQKINELNKLRDAYVAKKKKEKANSNDLESAMINAIKKQAKTKNYVW